MKNIKYLSDKFNTLYLINICKTLNTIFAEYTFLSMYLTYTKMTLIGHKASLNKYKELKSYIIIFTTIKQDVNL